MSWVMASCELIRAARGSRSQAALSRRLGYRGNPLSRWETGTRAPTAAQALRLLQTTGHDVAAAMAQVRRPAPQTAPVEDAAVAAWLASLETSRTPLQIAEQMGRDRSTVRRWMVGETRPRLPDFLHLVDVLSGQVTDFLDALVGIDAIPSLQARHKNFQEVRRLFAEEHASAAIRWMLMTEAYRRLPCHLAGWIGERLCIPLETETRCLDALVRTQVISWDGERYRVNGVPPLRVNGDPDQGRRLTVRRLEHAAHVIGQRRSEDMARTNVFVCSEEELQQVRMTLVRTFESIREQTLTTQNPQRVAAICVYLLGF